MKDGSSVSNTRAGPMDLAIEPTSDSDRTSASATTQRSRSSYHDSGFYFKDLTYPFVGRYLIIRGSLWNKPSRA